MNTKDKVLHMLFEDARLTPAQIAEMIGIPAAEAEAIIRSFERNHTIIGYKAMIDWDKTDTDRVTALIEVKTTPQKGMGFDEIARQIYSHRQVESVYLMSGGFDLTVIITCRTLREVALFVSEQLATMEHVTSTATHFILKKYKVEGIVLDRSKEKRLVVQP